MIRWKKIAGSILMVLSMLLAAAVLLNLIAFFKSFTELSGMLAYDISYLIGRAVILVLLIVLAVVCWRSGKKWAKVK